MKPLASIFALGILLVGTPTLRAADVPLTAKDISIDGRIDEHKANLIISASLNNADKQDELIFTSYLKEKVFFDTDIAHYTSEFEFRKLKGSFEEIEIAMEGDTKVQTVEGLHLLHWSLQHDRQAQTKLILTFADQAKDEDMLSVTVKHSLDTEDETYQHRLTQWIPKHPPLTAGLITIETAEYLVPTLKATSGLTRNEADAASIELAFQGTRYEALLQIEPRDPNAHRILLEDLKLKGSLSTDSLSFVLQGRISTDNPNGGSIQILGGEAALTRLDADAPVSASFAGGAYHLSTKQAGSFPFTLAFEARVKRQDGESQARFEIAPSALAPIELTGFSAGTQIDLGKGGPIKSTAAGIFHGFLPADGRVQLRWQQALEEKSSRLFFNTESVSQISIGTGVMRQTITTDIRVLQGELEAIEIDVYGPGEITRVAADDLLSWDLSEASNDQRRLSVRFNQPQTKATQVLVTTLTPIAAFPAEVTPIRLQPQESDRHHGFIEIVNSGAVRLNVTNTSGLSRITPKNDKATSEANSTAQIYPTQHFAFRHSSQDYALVVQASMIEPDIAASLLAHYHLDYNQTRIAADLELEIREAPIREFTIQVPRNYVLAEVTTNQLADYYVTAIADASVNQLRLVFDRQLAGRHQIQLRLERNEALSGTSWNIEKIAPQNTRQVRGHIGITSIEGFRLTPNQSSGLTEIATVYYPQKLAGIQTAFRITDSDWNLTLDANPIPQTIQVDSFHMFTLGNGIISGSSLLHYEISGAPLDQLEFAVPASYRNVEFTGENVRNWSQNENQYTVQLQSPIIGNYTLLATFERPFSDAADNLDASGVMPLGASSEQGTIVTASNRQINLVESEISPGIIHLTPEELSPENKLLVQQPVLSAYQYTESPVTLSLAIESLSETSGTSQIVERAAIETRISRDGQSVSTIRYVVKSVGLPHLELSIPENAQLWTASVDNQKVVPIETGERTLIPLPAEQGYLRIIELQVAATSLTPSPVTVTAPTLDLPIIHTSWALEAAPGQALKLLSGTIQPEHPDTEINGFEQLTHLFRGGRPWNRSTPTLLTIALGLFLLATVLIHFCRSEQIRPFRWRRCFAVTLALLTLGGSAITVTIVGLTALNRISEPEVNLQSRATITAPQSPLAVTVENRASQLGASDLLSATWPFVISLILAVWSRAQKTSHEKNYAELAAWLIALINILSWRHGGPLGLLVIALFLGRQLAWPAFALLRRGSQVLPNAPGVTLLMLICLFATGLTAGEIPERIDQELEIETRHVVGEVSLNWTAEARESLAFLRSPAVLTSIDYDSTKLRLTDDGNKRQAKVLTAREPGQYIVHFRYQLPLSESSNDRGFILPTQYALINELDVTLKLPKSTLEVPSAIAVTPQGTSTTNTPQRWRVIPPPANEVRISWVPQRRDRSEEKAVFFAEWTHLLTPSSGLVEGFHDLAVRPSQGEISRIVVTLPEDVTVNSVLANDLDRWRFDPDENEVVADLAKPQSAPFLIRILSQSVTQPLPFQTNHRFPRTEGASGQVGIVGIAAESNVQLAEVVQQGLVAIAPQDFSRPLLELCNRQFPTATVRQAYRYTDLESSLAYRAEAVEPNIHVTTNERLSIGEDRILLAAQIGAEVTRAGIFNLSFDLPDGLNVDSISGNQLSHWSELSNEGQRTITLHLKQRWQGSLNFNITLSGSGLTNVSQWQVPKISLHEASRQRGQLAILPEQGIRLQAVTRENTSQIDARSQGFSTTGALAFDLLNADWNLVLSTEQVDAWIEITSLQDVLFTDGKANVQAVLDAEIKNTAVKEFEILLPEAATNVRFDGKAIADAIQAPTNNDNRQNWTVRLEQKVIGNYRLNVSYQRRLEDDEAPLLIQGIQLVNSSSHRGYLTLRTEGRLQIAVPQLPESIYLTDWAHVARPLQQSLPENVAITRCYRIVDPNFELPASVSRHQVASILAAEVLDFDLNTVISASGTTLTRASIKLIPGSKRSLAVTLPPSSEFWFARVNHQGVQSWTQNEDLIVPLSNKLSEDSETTVDLYYQSTIGNSSASSLTTALQCLTIDIPANNVDWNVILDPLWQFEDWQGDLELVQVTPNESAALVDFDTFIREEMTRRAGRNQEAEDWLAQGNQYLSQGNDKLALNAFRNSLGLTLDDAAFNEDARVQLRTVKTQQAMAGISVQQRQSKFSLNTNPEGVFPTLESAEAILANTDPTEESQLLNLADRLIEQHEDASVTTSGFGVVIPREGTLLQFVKSVQVEDAANLRIQIKARRTSNRTHYGVIAGLLILLGGTVMVRNRLSPEETVD